MLMRKGPLFIPHEYFILHTVPPVRLLRNWYSIMTGGSLLRCLVYLGQQEVYCEFCITKNRLWAKIVSRSLFRILPGPRFARPGMTNK